MPYEPYFASINVIALGVALLAKSSSVAAQFRRLQRETGGELLVSVAAVTFGILAFTLGQPATTTLVFVGLLSLGAAEVLTGFPMTGHVARKLSS